MSLGWGMARKERGDGTLQALSPSGPDRIQFHRHSLDPGVSMSTETASDTTASPDWKEIMERSFSRMDAEVVTSPGGPRSASYWCELQTPKCDHVGSKTVVAVVSADRVVVANCGDSHAVLCWRGAPVPLSSDHKVSLLSIHQ